MISLNTARVSAPFLVSASSSAFFVDFAGEPDASHSGLSTTFFLVALVFVLYFKAVTLLFLRLFSGGCHSNKSIIFDR